MNYGSSSYGSVSLGGTTASQWFMFFPFLVRDADVPFESRLEYGGTGLFSVFTRQGSEAAASSSGVVYRVYTSNDPDETPQLQQTQEGDGQVVIPATRFIVVTVHIDPVIWAGGQNFEVRGRAGD